MKRKGTPRSAVIVVAAVMLISVIVAVVIDSGHRSPGVAGPPQPSATRPTSSRTATTKIQQVTVPNLVGLSETSVAEYLAPVWLMVSQITLVPSTTVAGRIVSQRPPPGSQVKQDSPVTLSVSEGGIGSPPAVPPTGSQCVSRNASDVDGNGYSGPVCLQVGARLTVTFISSGGWSGYGEWNSGPPAVSNVSVLTGGPYGFSAKAETAVFTAVGEGTAMVTAAFDVGCAPANTTPCTVPPLSEQTLTVTVVNPA